MVDRDSRHTLYSGNLSRLKHDDADGNRSVSLPFDRIPNLGFKCPKPNLRMSALNPLHSRQGLDLCVCRPCYLGDTRPVFLYLSALPRTHRYRSVYSQRRPLAARNKLQQSPLLHLTEPRNDPPEQLDRIVMRETGDRRIRFKILHVNRRFLTANDLTELVLIKHAQPLVVDDLR